MGDTGTGDAGTGDAGPGSGTGGTGTTGVPDLVELRVHGVGGPPPEEVLGVTRAEVEPVEGTFGINSVLPNRACGVWRRAWDDRTRAFVWGDLTSGSPLQALWIFLLPFTLTNVAGWMIPEQPLLGRRFTRWLVRMAGFLMTLTWVSWGCLLVVDVGAYGAGRHLVLPPALITGLFLGALAVALVGFVPARVKGGRVLTSAAPALVLLGLAVSAEFWVTPWVRVVTGLVVVGGVLAALLGLAGRSQADFEDTSPDGAVDRMGVTGSDEDDLTDPTFFRRAQRVRRLRRQHVAVCAVSLIGFGVLGVFQASHDRPLAFSSVFVVVGSIQFVLLAVLFVAALPRSLPPGPHEHPHRLRTSLACGPAVACAWGALLANGSFVGLDLWLRGMLDNRLRTNLGAQVAAAASTVSGGAVQSVNVPAVPARGVETVLVDAHLIGLMVFVGSVALTVLWRSLIRVNETGLPPVGDPARSKILARRHLAHLGPHLDVPLGVGAGVSYLTAAVFAAARFDLGRFRKDPWPLPFRLSAPTAGVQVPGWARSLGIAGPIPSLVGLAEWLLPLAVLGLVALVRSASADSAVRRNVGNLWDVLTFWPRWYQPFGVRPYSERAVPLLQAVLADHAARGEAVVLVAHSQGSALAVAAVAGADPGSLPARLALVTYGSPLTTLYARFFPSEVHDLVLEETRTRLAQGLAAPGEEVGWRNFYRLTDHIGQQVFDVAPTPDINEVLGDPATKRPEGLILPGETSVERDLPPGWALSGHNDYRREWRVKQWVAVLHRALPVRAQPSAASRRPPSGKELV